jgi:hypothetical protein
MSIKIDYLHEPTLQFGAYFEHADTKMGLAEFGPFGKNVDGLHPSAIKLGFIGTRETISEAQGWVDECSREIQSENVKTINATAAINGARLFEDEEADHQYRLEKILNRDFIGFNRQSQFACCFLSNPRWERSIDPRELAKILGIADKQERIHQLVDAFEAEIKSLASTSPSPDIIVLALPNSITDEAARVRVSGNFYLDFRRAIKARAMKWGKPIQIIREATLKGKGRMQEKATRAWNFCTAQYYKADGVPWRPSNLDADVCFIGINFYVTQQNDTKLTMRSSLAQAFDYLGQGLVLRGDPFDWDVEKLGRTPHLTQSAARKLVKQTLEEYLNVSHKSAKRVVIHKTSEFWGADHGEHNELEGFYEGIADVFPRCETDFVAVRQTGIRLFREGAYPPLRGTYFSVDDAHHFLYTMGYIPYLETYTGSYVPEPWQLTQHIGGSAPKDLFREILALTKMNVNNCSFADGRPITLSFSKMIGDIMKHVPENGQIRPQYQFYM